MTDEKKLLTEKEYALTIGKFYLSVYDDLKTIAGQDADHETIRMAAEIATLQSVRHYHYYVEAAGKPEAAKSPGEEDMATDKQIDFIKNLVLDKKRLRLPLEEFKALTAGTLKLTKARAKELIDSVVK